MCKWYVLCCVAVASAVPGPELRLFSAPAAYDLDTTVLLNDVTRSNKEVGYKIRATLDLVPLWSHAHTDFFLKFHLHSPKLYLRGKHVNADFMPYDSVWDSYSDTTFYAHWSSGSIKQAYLDPSELPDVLNYKKALLSLFQFQVVDGEYNETDVTGPCLVLYEKISVQVFRKIKSRCEVDGGGAVSDARRVSRYTVSDALDALQALHAEELLTLGHGELGLKVRGWHSLRRRPAAPAPAPPAASLAGALRALRELHPLHELHEPRRLHELAAPGDEDDADDKELPAALEANRAALEGDGAGEGGASAAAAAALQLLPSLRHANHSALLQLLQRDDMHDALPGLCRLLGLTATRASHAAVRDFLQLNARDPLQELAHTYLAAFALADAPDEGAVLELLRLGDEGRSRAVAESALLAAAAAAAAARAPPGLAQAARAALARGLARCGDARCRAVRLRALGNLRRADTADLLLEHAERGAAGEAAERDAALAALDALGAAPERALTFARLDRLGALALDERAPLELRAAALDLVTLRRAPLPAPLARLAHALHARGPHELRRVLWQRMAALAPLHAPLRALPGLLEPVLRGWDAQAHAGSSSVLVRGTGWQAGGWSAQLESVQLARKGLLRRGTVRLQAQDGHDRTFDALTVEVWTRGLEAFGGGSSEATESDPGDASADGAEEAAGGLALAVGGARLRDISLFNGQAELLGHVWAGTASSPTPVLRALQPLLDARADVPLLAGVRVRARARAALALALDAQTQVSLWWRSARAELELRAGLAGVASARVRTAWGAASARAAVRAEPRLRIAADLDFHEAVALCVRVRTERLQLERAVTLLSQQGARRLRVRRERVTRHATPGRTLALGRPNDVTCRTLRSAEPSADEDEA